MKCPHCHLDIRESRVVSAAAAIWAKRRAKLMRLVALAQPVDMSTPAKARTDAEKADKR